MTINERFEAIIKVLFGGNKRAFALHIGVNPTVVENVVGTRKGKPSFDFLEKVCANANISAEWLLMGKGEMLMDMFEFRKTPMVFHSNPDLYENKQEEILTNETNAPTKQDSISTDNPITAQSIAPEIVTELLNRITEQAAEIGRLNEQLRQMQNRLEKDASDANTFDTANAG